MKKILFLMIITLASYQFLLSQYSATIMLTDSAKNDIDCYWPTAVKAYAKVVDMDGDKNIDKPDSVLITFYSKVDTIGEQKYLIETGNSTSTFTGSIDLSEIKSKDYVPLLHPDGLLQVRKPESLWIIYNDVGDYNVHHIRKDYSLFGVFDGVVKSYLQWNKTNSPYYVNNLFLDYCGLYIHEGVEIRFMRGGSILGLISAIITAGTKDNPVIFTSNELNPLPGDWEGIAVDGISFIGSSNNYNYTKIEYANIAITGLIIFKGSFYNVNISNCITGINLGHRFNVNITNSRIENNITDGIVCTNENPSPSDILNVSKSYISDNGGSGINLKYNNGSIFIDSSEISGNGNDGIKIWPQWYGDVNVKRSNICNNRKFDISNGTKNIDARGNWWGVNTYDSINTGGNPKNLEMLFDGYDYSGGGIINYALWRAERVLVNPNDYPFELIIDANTGSGYYKEYGNGWRNEPSVLNQNFGKMYYSFQAPARVNAVGDGNDKAVFKFKVSKAGCYRIDARWNNGVRNAVNTPITIYSSGQKQKKYLDQTSDGDKWNEVGWFDFSGNGIDSIVVSDSAGRGNSDTTFVCIDAIKIVGPDSTMRTDVFENSLTPVSYKLLSNFPNPFNPSTNLQYSLPGRSNVKLTIFNILGQTISVIVNQMQEAGWHTVEWNAKNAASGIYFYRLEAVSLENPSKQFVETKKMLLVR